MSAELKRLLNLSTQHAAHRPATANSTQNSLI